LKLERPFNLMRREGCVIISYLKFSKFSWMDWMGDAACYYNNEGLSDGWIIKDE